MNSAAKIITLAAEEQLVLVQQGRPRATLVMADRATDQAKEAAVVLRDYLARITGAELSICRESEPVEGARILVGHSAAVKSLGVELPAGVTSQMDEEGLVIRRVARDLVVGGNEDWHYRGTVFAAYHFLELLGCRWFFPGSYGEVVPEHSTIAVPDLDIEERPSFRMRNIWYSGWMPSEERDQAALKKWYDCNKAHPMHLSAPGDGTVVRLAPPERYFDSHRHIYALDEKGQRRPEMLCLSEPETLEIAIATILEAFRADPQMFTFGFAPPDGLPLCHCDRCVERLHGFTAKHVGRPSLSDAWFFFVNEIAREVKREFPDRWLLTNGYANRVYPPEGIANWSDNIGIQLAFLQSCTLHRINDPRCWQRQDYGEILKRWTDLGPVMVYDYDPGVGLENLPFPALHNLAYDLPRLAELGVWGFWTEGQNCWLRTHLNYYVRARLMWDVRVDVAGLVREYCEAFYGGAAEAVERYVWVLEQAVEQTDVHVHWRWREEVPWWHIFPETLVDELEEVLALAARDAGTGAHRLHVQALQIAHEHLRAFTNMQRQGNAGDFQQALDWAGRVREARDRLADIEPSLLPHTPDWVVERGGNSLEGMQNLYQGLADRGEVVAMLPEEWEFKIDPDDEGLIRQWYLPDQGQGWDWIRTDLPWENQGYQDERGYGYVGYAWYRTDVEVSDGMADQRLQLTFGGVYGRAIWIWINGLLVCFCEEPARGQPLDVEVSGHIQPGQVNHVALRLQSLGKHDRVQGGICRRAFLWRPGEFT